MTCTNKQYSVIQLRRDTNANFVSSNIILGSGEPGFAVDTKILKIGNGVTPWNNLSTPSSSGSYLINSSGNYLAINNLHVTGSGRIDNISISGNIIRSINGNIIINPSGTGSLQRDSGGNARGQYSVDWQTARSFNGEVANGNYNVIGGGQNNATSGPHSTVGGGYGNKCVANGSGNTIGGGSNNVNYGNFNTIGGGKLNEAFGFNSTICGGISNIIHIDQNYCSIGGGASNNAFGNYTTIGGGKENLASGNRCSILGGEYNQILASDGAIAGGSKNLITYSHSIIGGGRYNTINSGFTAICGGYYNTAGGAYNFIGGGQSNVSSDDYSTIGGGKSNHIPIGGLYSTICGGFSNTSSSYYSTIGGGLYNITSGDRSAIGGGVNNKILLGSQSSTIGGGDNNTIHTQFGTIAGGRDNTMNGGFYNTIGGGFYNQTQSCDYGTIAGGRNNMAIGVYSTIPGGYGAKTSRFGEFAHAMGFYTHPGDAQHSIFVLRNSTTGNPAGPTEMIFDIPGVNWEYLEIASGSLLSGTINILGVKDSGASVARYLRQFTIKNINNTTSLVGSIITLGTDEVNGTSISVTANDTNDYLSIKTSGVNNETWRWVAVVDAIKMEYGS